MMNMMTRAITEGWIISENASDAVMIRKFLQDKNYLYFCCQNQMNQDSIERRLDTIPAVFYFDISCFYKKIKSHATITQALMVVNPFVDYGQLWWDTLILDENQEAYVYGRNGKHNFRQFIGGTVSGATSIEINQPKLFS